jgi:hypothetical protein
VGVTECVLVSGECYVLMDGTGRLFKRYNRMNTGECDRMTTAYR